jgi:hypothetical protein
MGELAPDSGRSQRLLRDVEVAIDFPDGRSHVISAPSLWVVTSFPVDDVDLDPAEHEVGELEFRRVVGRDDTELIPALAEFAAMVDYSFDEDAASEWVVNNDGGFYLPVTGYRAEQYRIYLGLIDTEFDNVVSLFVNFPTSSEDGWEGNPIEEFQEFDLDSVLFDGAPIEAEGS